MMEELKFKVSDKIKEIGKDNTPLTIVNINMAEECYICDNNSVIYFKDQYRWELSSYREKIDNIKECAKVSESLYSNKALLNYQQGFVDGAEWRERQLLGNAIERTVTLDAGGYPRVDLSSIEFYDYTEDKPLAKEGDKVKIILIKE